MTPDADLALYARQILLPELGFAGQTRLSATRVRVAASADPRAAAVAEEYLSRAGAGAQPNAASELVVSAAGSDAIARLAGAPELEECAAWLAGALAAVEGIKASAGIGEAVALNEKFSLLAEVG